MELLLTKSRELGTALLLITHDLGVVASACSRMVTMYAGQVVESGPVRQTLRQPLNPYTSGLLRSLPRLSARKAPLPVIKGRVPSALAMPTGCRFAPRCAYAAPPMRRTAAFGDGGREPGSLLPARGPRPARHRGMTVTADLIAVEDLAVHFPTDRARETVRAVDGVSFAVRRSEIFGVIGESGSGKSTLGRALLCLDRPTSGRVLHEGTDPFTLSIAERRRRRRGYQMVFQDPHGALNPRMTALASVREPLDVAGEGSREERNRRALHMLDHVGLSTEQAERYPHQLSGGQKQRVNIARALTLSPKLLVCDEAVAALDVSVQAGIINLLADLQQEFGLAYVFITHDIGVVSHISDRVAVMYLGRLMELGPTEQVEQNPLHPYTAALLSAEPALEEIGSTQRIILKGEISVAHRAAIRLPLPHALPARRGPLRRERTGMAGACPRPLRRVPFRHRIRPPDRDPNRRLRFGNDPRDNGADTKEPPLMTTGLNRFAIHRRSVLAATAGLALGQGGIRTSRAAPVRGGTLRCTVWQTPGTLDPITGRSGSDHSFLYPIFDTLVDFDAKTMKPLRAWRNPGAIPIRRPWCWSCARAWCSTTARRSTRPR